MRAGLDVCHRALRSNDSRLDELISVGVSSTGVHCRPVCAVWEAIRAIPFGETISYGPLATRVSCPRAVRAAGATTGRNPIPVIVPCHRVVGSDGSLTGYGGGLERKRTLLGLEARVSGLASRAAEGATLLPGHDPTPAR